MFFGGRNKSKKIILFDFRSSSVAAAIIAVDEEISLPKILFTKRENYYFTEAPQADEFIMRAHIALKKLIGEINHFKIKDPDIEHAISEVRILYGAPWYTPNFIDIHHEQDKDFIFTRELLSKIIKNTDKKLEIKIDSEIIEKNLSSILINGYETDDPFKKKTRDVKMSFYLAYVASETKNEIERIIKNNLHVDSDKIYGHSHTAVLHSFLKSNFHSANNYVLLDVSGEMTEITIVRNSFFKKHITVPVGSHIFSRKLAEVSGFDLHTAWSHLNIFLEQKNEPKIKKKIENVFEDIKDYYLQEIKKSFLQEKIIDIPPKIFVVADNEVRNLVKNVFESHDGYAGALKMSRRPDVISFNRDTFSNLCLYAPGVNTDNIISIFSNFVKMYSNTD
jgi:hypothetical protein